MTLAAPAEQRKPDGERFAQLEHGLQIAQPGVGMVERLDLGAALQKLNIPSVSIALIDHGELAWARAFGRASTHTLYQAASMSKLVTAVAALRLVQQGGLDLDRNVNAELVSWHILESELTKEHPVTLRGLLSMTGGVGVPGYLGYAPRSPLPDLVQILDGAPPAKSPPVRVERVPGQSYAYSGGGYEIVQAIIEDRTRLKFAEAMRVFAVSAARHVGQLLRPAAPARDPRADSRRTFRERRRTLGRLARDAGASGRRAVVHADGPGQALDRRLSGIPR